MEMGFGQKNQLGEVKVVLHKLYRKNCLPAHHHLTQLLALSTPDAGDTKMDKP